MNDISDWLLMFGIGYLAFCAVLMISLCKAAAKPLPRREGEDDNHEPSGARSPERQRSPQGQRGSAEQRHEEHEGRQG